MRRKKEFDIAFSGLKIGTHEFEFQIANDFFDLFEYDEFNSVNVDVKATLIKKETLMELYLSQTGTVNIPCDVTGENFDLPIESNWQIIIKFGEEYNDDNEELLIIPYSEYQVNIAQYIYEMIALSVPVKRVHPSIAADYEVDDFDEDDFDFLQEYNEDDFADEDEDDPTDDSNQNKNKEIDPRWDELKKLLTDK